MKCAMRSFAILLLAGGCFGTARAGGFTGPQVPTLTPIMGDYCDASRAYTQPGDVTTLIQSLQDAGVNDYFQIGTAGSRISFEEMALHMQPLGIRLWKYYPAGLGAPSQDSILQIATLSLQYTNIQGIVYDDFSFSVDYYPPDYCRNLMTAVHAINPRLQFLVVCYYDGGGENGGYFARIAEHVRQGVVDGILFPYAFPHLDHTTTNTLMSQLQDWRAFLDKKTAQGGFTQKMPVTVMAYATAISLATGPKPTPSYVNSLLDIGRRATLSGLTRGGGMTYMMPKLEREFRAAAREAFYADGPLLENLLVDMPYPTGLTAVADSPGQINLAWSDTSADETGFCVQRKITGGDRFTLSQTAPANATSFADTNGLVSGTPYTYRVYAVKGTGNSCLSGEATATTLGAPPAMTAPSGLRVTDVQDTQVGLCWSDNSSNEAWFQIERKTGAGGTYSNIASVGPNVTNYTDVRNAMGYGGVMPQTLYYYRVRAGHAAINSAWSAETNATTLVDTHPPETPPQPGIKYVTQTTVWLASLSIRVRDNAAVVGFRCYANGVLIGTQGAGPGNDPIGGGEPESLIFQHWPTPNVMQEYYLKAFDAAGNESAPSPSVFSMADSIPPTTPANFITTGQTTNSIALAWRAATDNSGVVGYAIPFYAGDDPTVKTGLAAAGNSTNVTHINLSPGSLFHYQIQARDGVGNLSPLSTPVLDVMTLGPDTQAPTVPQNVAVAWRSQTSVSLSWGRSIDNVAVTGYRIYRDGVEAGTSATTNWTDTGLLPDTTYLYQVAAYDAAGNSSANSSPLLRVKTTWDATPPTLTVLTPHDLYYTTNSVVAVAGTASDMSGLLEVAVNGNEALSSDGFATWHGAYLVALTNGTNLITVTAEDPYENTTTVGRRVIRTLDPPPTVILISPAYGARHTAPVNVSLLAAATDDVSVAVVEFFSGDQKLGQAAAAPYGFVWTNAPAGVHRLTARATDSAGQVSRSGPVDVTIVPAGGNQPPTVVLTGPTNGASFNGPLNIALLATAADDVAVAKVEFYRGAVKIGESTAEPYGLLWPNVEEGSYRLTARAVDYAGRVATSAVANIAVVEPASSDGKPGGVGSASDLGLWCRADDAGGVMATNPAGGYMPAGPSGKVCLWRDLSEMEDYDRAWHNRLASVNDAESPLLATNVANGLPMLWFDGNTRLRGPAVGADNHLLDCTQWTIIAVNRYVAYSGESRYVFQTGQEKGNGPPFTEYPAISMGSRRTIPTMGWQFVAYNANNYSYTSDGAGNNTLMHIDTLTLQGSLLRAYYNGRFEDDDFAYANSVPYSVRQVSVGWGKNPWNDPKPAGWFQGHIGEVIVFHRPLNQAERVIVENYLAAKYGLTMSDGDRYAGDDPAKGDYDREVIGIGRELDVVNAQAYGAGLTLASYGTQANGDYVLAGHKTATNSLVTSNLPAGVAKRWSRVWYLDKSGAPQATIGFDWSRGGLAADYDPSLTPRLLYRASDGGAFSVLDVPASVTGDQATFSLPSAALADGYYTLGLADDTPPTLAVHTPGDLSCATGSAVEVAGTAWDAAGIAGVTVNGGAATTSDGYLNWSRTVTGLALGTNVLAVAAVDSRGNAVTSEVRVIRVDSPSALAILSPPGTTHTLDNWILVSGLAVDNDGVASVTVNGVPAGTSDGYLNWACLVSGLLPGTNVLTAESVDGLGNRRTTQVSVVANELAPLPEVNAIPSVRAGIYHSVALDAGGSLWAWGRGDDGRLGIGASPPSQSLPVSVAGLTRVVGMAAGDQHTLALRGDTPQGWSWGGNVYGQLGDGTAVSHSSPASLAGLRSAAALTAGYVHSLALKPDGTVWAWGRNNYGQLGLGTAVNESIPVRIGALTSVAAIDAGGYHTLALKANGTVWAWGQNSWGELGDGTTQNRSVPVQVAGLSNVVAVAGGFGFSAALKADGSLWAWGDNTYGQLGDGTTNNRSQPVKVPGISNVVVVTLGDHHLLALRRDGTLWGCGANYYGQVGNSSTVSRTTLAAVVGLTNVVSVDGGGGHSLAVKADGSVWGWGWNSKGQLGDGTKTTRTVPVLVTNLNLGLPNVGPPAVTIEPPDLTCVTNPSVVLQGAATSPLIVREVTVNGSAVASTDGFAHWTRTVSGLAMGTNTLTVTARDMWLNVTSVQVRVIYVTGNYDGNGDGIPDLWQMRHFGSGFMTRADAEGDADPDDDGMRNREEWTAGTDPTDPFSRLAIEGIAPLGTGVVVRWQSVAGKQYSGYRSTNLLAVPAFNGLFTNVVGQPDWTEYLDTNAAGRESFFYRIGVE